MAEKPEHPTDPKVTPNSESVSRRRFLAKAGLAAAGAAAAAAGGWAAYSQLKTPSFTDDQQDIFNMLYAGLYRQLEANVRRAKAENKTLYVVMGDLPQYPKCGLLSLMIMDIMHRLDEKGAGGRLFLQCGDEEIKTINRFKALPEKDIFNSRETAAFYARTDHEIPIIALEKEETAKKAREALTRDDPLYSMQPERDRHMIKTIEAVKGQGGLVLTGFVHSKAIVEGLEQQKNTLVVPFNIMDLSFLLRMITDRTADKPGGALPPLQKAAYEFILDQERVSAPSIPGKLMIGMEISRVQELQERVVCAREDHIRKQNTR